MTPLNPAPAAGTNPRSVGLPVEHGGWGFTLEPVLLGLLVAPSAAALELSVAALAVFLARRPAKLVATDLVRRRWLPRSATALRFFGVYGVVAIAGVVGALVTSEAPFWSPLVVVLPLAAVALYADARSKSRTASAELAGSVSMGATVAAIALAAGWDAASAYGLWLVLAARAVTTVMLVRGQIRRLRRGPSQAAGIYGIEGAALVVVIVAAAAGWVPWLAIVAVGGIGVFTYLSLNRPPVAAKTIGWTQIVLGLTVVLLTAIGVWLDW
jgi:hypothetical protein